MHPEKLRFLLIAVLGLSLVGSSLVFGQDLNEQKQAKLKEIREVDKKLADNPTKDEYDTLIKQREKLTEDVKEIEKKLMSDVEALQKVNAVKKAFNDGNNAYKLGQYQQAVEHYDKAISLDRTFYRAYYGKGLALRKIRKSTEAIDALEGAIEQNPAYDVAAVELGKIYSQTGQDDKAIDTFSNSVKNSPQAYKAYYELGRVYLDKKKEYNKAAENFAKATAINKEYDLAFLSLGIALTELGRLEEATLALENALAVTSKRKWEGPHYRLAVIYNKQGKFSDGKSAAQKALENKQDYAPAAFEAGKACKELGQFDQAITFFQTAAKDRVWKRSAEYEIDLIQNRDKYGGN